MPFNLPKLLPACRGRIWCFPISALLLTIAVIVTFYRAWQKPETPCQESACYIYQLDVGGIFGGLASQINHIAAFAVIALLLYSCLSYFWYNQRRLTLVATCLICLLLGLLIEICQPKVGRYFDVLDLIADTVGIILGILAWEIIACTTRPNPNVNRPHEEGVATHDETGQ